MPYTVFPQVLDLKQFDVQKSRLDDARKGMAVAFCKEIQRCRKEDIAKPEQMKHKKTSRRKNIHAAAVR